MISRPNQKRALLELHKVLDRQTQVSGLSSLTQSISKVKNSITLENAAIGFDANVLLRIASHKKSSDIFDYLLTAHKPPIILPGQCIQEFWNNQLSAIDTVASAMEKDFTNFTKRVQKVGVDFENYFEDFNNLIDKFSNDHGNVYTQKTLGILTTFFDSISKKAVVPYVPRSNFYNCAKVRKLTKTPPGYQDDQNNFGDCFVWFDFLYGLKLSKLKKEEFSNVIFVSNEKKHDWRRGSTAHPILLAEVKALFDIDFEIWNLDELAAGI